MRTEGKNQKTYLFGALDAHSGELHVGFWPRRDSVAFVDFLRAFLATEEGRRLHLRSVPTYSPWLNPIEISWRIVKSRAGRNQGRVSLEQSHADFHETLTHLGARLMAPSSYDTHSQGPTWRTWVHSERSTHRYACVVGGYRFEREAHAVRRRTVARQ